ncbi:MAG: TIGR02757 family protein [Muribaculaceae bacterium]|nr:TIGR02757 family protein [Muribaculaceae bacterium]
MSDIILPDKDIIELLDSEAARINRPEFIENDPVQFPRRFSDPRDIEIAAFLSAIIAWGKRTMICRDAEKMLSLMDHQPYKYTMEEGYLDLDPDMNIHRTFFARDFIHFLRGMRRIMLDYGSLDALAASHKVGDENAPAWRLVEEMQKIMMAENNGVADSRCLPVNLSQSALKRVNMALRWLVRDDGIVDMGIWKAIPKSKLFIPLDVHVGNTARNLGLLSRRSNDRKSVVSLTDTLRLLRPDDPVYYDYALFGIGVGE